MENKTDLIDQWPVDKGQSERNNEKKEAGSIQAEQQHKGRWKTLKRHTYQLIAKEKLTYYYEWEEKKLHIYNSKVIP